MLESLRNQGIINPSRIEKLIQKAIHNQKLDLSGLIVLTEAASGNYVVTPLIAALAGADKVFAYTKDSIYKKATEVEKLTSRLAKFCGINNKIEVLFEKSPQVIHQADIITNLGFIRPIDRKFISAMKDNSVISLMSEAWELREEDLDLKACREFSVPVMGTDEEHPGLDVFRYCGNLCLKMLFELQIEAYKSKIVIVSDDKFGNVIEKTLKSIGGEVYLVKELKTDFSRTYLRHADVIVIANYTSLDIFIGTNGHISAMELYTLSPGISVIQFAGNVCIEELKEFGIPYFPKHKIGSLRMGLTLADLGPTPVIDLHCAGLKVGEEMHRAKLLGLSGQSLFDYVTKNSPAQVLTQSC